MECKKRILIVEDEEAFLEEFISWLERDDREIFAAADFEQGVKALREVMPHLTLLDMRLPPSGTPQEGMRLLELSRKVNPRGKVVVLTMENSRSKTLEATRKGVSDYLVKPLDPDEVQLVVQRTLERQALEEEIHSLRERLVRENEAYGIVGRSRAISNLFKSVSHVAGSTVNVLIYGESGTGKELIAQALHKMSPRKDTGNFVPVNIGAINESTQDSELFGHEKGAFTDAKRALLGPFEIAHNGTIFLDEIENMAMSTQIRLLRVIEEKKIKRMGSERQISVDVRIISATNVDPRKLLEEGKLREDLFYRLNMYQVVVPPLRERIEDIEPLANYFLHLFSREEHKDVFGFDKEVISLFEGYHWPGNVRELRNQVHRLVLDTNQNTLVTAKNLVRGGWGDDDPGSEQQANGNVLEEAVRLLECKMIRKAIRKSGGNISRAAEALGINRQQIYRKIKKYNIGLTANST